MKFNTKAVHAGQEPDPQTGAVNVPVYLTSTYAQRNQDAYVYGRTGNPTRTALETSLAALEGGDHGLAFASGMAAITTVATLLRQGDHVVVSDDVYGGVYRLFRRILADYGIDFTFVDMTDLGNVEAALRDTTRIVWTESPTNPLMKVVDLRALADVARQAGALTVVDNTFASPYLQRPLELGADVVVHSTTKYLGGHSDVVGGALVTSDEDVHERLRFSQNAVGSVPSPLDCYLVLRGIRTLPVRMERHCDNAEALARALAELDEVVRVHYPGLGDDPGHEVARRQMDRFGGMLSFELGDSADVVGRLGRLKLIVLAESLGGVESLIEHPASMTHASVPAEERSARGITDGLVRLSVGIEDAEDLEADLRRLFEG